MWPVSKGGFEYMVNVMWALTDFTQHNGATLLWPRSHHEPPRRSRDPAHALAAVMSRGSALVYLGSLTHCGGANKADRPRTGLLFGYSLGWLKQYENAFLSYPPHIARTFSPAVRDLLGYRIHRPNLGGYEGQDPAVLFETNSHTLPAVDALPGGIAAELAEYYRARD
jgi:ectoine hydroxylase-related dioxygenase (phytanoyl-CoA dioxygenase family)